MTSSLTCGSNVLVRLVYYPANLSLFAVDRQVSAIDLNVQT
ncbi:MAG: hypothetical protein ACXV8O_15500 [Methylobacter sp.]